MSEAAPVDWNKVKRTFLQALAAVAVADAGASYYWWEAQGVFVSLALLLCLALGFWITERLIAVFAGKAKANLTAVLLLFFGKLGWWAALFWCSRHIPPGLEKAAGLGIIAFLIALLCAMLRHYGMPRISEGNPPSTP